MPNAARHIIKRQILELHGLREQDALPFQQRVGALFNQHIIPLLDRYFDALSPNGQLVRIEKLELDLGRIGADDLESELLHQLEWQLRAQLPEFAPGANHTAPAGIGSALPTPPTGAEDPSGNPAYSIRELLHFFVRTGNLPWWSGAAAGSDPVLESLDILIQQEPTLLTRDLCGWVAQESYLRRLVRHLPDEALIRLAALRIHLPPAVFATAAPQFFRLLPRVAALATLPLHRVREEALLKLLQIVFSAPDPFRDAHTFWEVWLLQVAVALRVKYQVLLQTLKEGLAVDTAQSSFQSMVRQLMSGKAGKNRPVSALERLIHALEQALLPEKAAPSPEALKKWIAVLARLLRDATLTASLRAALSAAKTRLGAPDFQVSELRALLAQIARAEAGATLQQQQANHSSGEALAKWKRGPEQTLSEKAAPSPEAMTFSHAGELFVDNAGLVILWPFLNPFFQALGLLENNQFTNTAAAHRAASLLQYVADGQPEAPEYFMGLNKILCGLAWDAVLDPGPPRTETETEECEALLQAVVANAPVLRNMSADGLRGSFLLRKGMLRAVPGALELHVEKETHDVVLERFPWSWKVVKLPWMEGVMVVEW